MKASSDFVCQQCGYVSPSYLGKCPNCGAWSSLVETMVETQSSKLKARNRRTGGSGRIIKLADVEAKKMTRAETGITELDRALGGGIVPGMAVLLAGEPGIGKSTLLLELASHWGNGREGTVLYVAGEESAGQIKIRAERLGIKSGQILVLEETDADRVAEQIQEQVQGQGKNKDGVGPLVIVDSIQTMTTGDLSGGAGSVGQVRETASRLIMATKPYGVPLFLVGHVTKEGTIAGPKVLEHAVDTVLNLEGERFQNLRLIRATKNRFGPTDEVGVFEMSDSGLRPATDLQGFVTEAHGTKPGSCLTVAMEGTRPMLVEIQALTTNTTLPAPRRVGNGIDYQRLQMIVAVLQKRLSLPLYKEDIYLNVAGGIKIEEPAVDLPVALAVLSSFRDKALPAKTVAIGELDLLGNVRRVNSLEKRLKEAKALKLNNIISPENLSSLNRFKL